MGEMAEATELSSESGIQRQLRSPGSSATVIAGLALSGVRPVREWLYGRYSVRQLVCVGDG